ncbi:MAG: hypothetical protein IJT16_15640 [Lachnospiraceae bacterium]|nr:hypothetical protein [Lachnospiraceae bacterium]
MRKNMRSESEKFKKAFKSNFNKLCTLYVEDESNNANSYVAVYNDIQDYCERTKMNGFAEITFKKWLAGEVIPDSYFICLLCEFFGCDANYLFDIDSIDVKAGPNQSLNKAEKYIYDNYGLDRETMNFFKEYKNCGIDSSDDRDAAHLAESSEKSFSSLFNLLIHESPWTISSLLQILYAKRLDLSSYGFPEIDVILKSNPDFSGISRHLVQGFDIDVAISVFSIRLKQLLSDPNYVPCQTNSIETYDAKLLTPGAVDKFISELLSSRLKNLNAEINELTSLIAKDPSEK